MIALLCWTLLLAQAQADLPRLTAPVNDFARVIDESSAAEMNRRIRALQRASGDAIVVVTVDTYAPFADIDEYAVKLFENQGAGIGVKGKDNGAVIVVAVRDRKVRIEVGYGLEEFITDGYAGETRDVMTEYFRRGEYGPGLLAGSTRLINRVAERRGITLQDVPQEAPSGRLPVGQLFVFAFIIFVVLSSLFRGRPRRRYWGRGPWSGWSSGVGPFGGGSWGGGFGGFGGGFGGGGGGFGGFGGGRSGGGGASGGW